MSALYFNGDSPCLSVSSSINVGNKSVTSEGSTLNSKVKRVRSELEKNPESIFSTPSSHKKIKLQKDDKITVFLKAIQQNQNDSALYLGLACLRPLRGCVTLLDGTIRTRQQLLLESIHLNPNNFESYYKLAESLSNGGEVQLKNGIQMTKKQLYCKTIDLNPRHFDAYIKLAELLSPNEECFVFNNEVTVYLILALLVKYQPNNSYVYYLFAKKLYPNTGFTFPDGTLVTVQQMLFVAILLNPNDSEPYYYLLTRLKNGQSVKLPHGHEITYQTLCLQLLHLKPEDPENYHRLANTLSNGASIKLLDGREVSQLDLLNTSLKIKPDQIEIRIKIKLLTGNFTSNLGNVGDMEKTKLCLEAIKLYPDFAYAYCMLASIFNGIEPNLRLRELNETTPHQLYLKAIELDPKCLEAYKGLLNESRTIILKNGKELSKEEICQRIIELDPNDVEASMELRSKISLNSLKEPINCNQTAWRLRLEQFKRNLIKYWDIKISSTY